jgi:hypothetical protein
MRVFFFSIPAFYGLLPRRARYFLEPGRQNANGLPWINLRSVMAIHGAME